MQEEARGRGMALVAGVKAVDVADVVLHEGLLVEVHDLAGGGLAA